MRACVSASQLMVCEQLSPSKRALRADNNLLGSDSRQQEAGEHVALCSVARATAE